VEDQLVSRHVSPAGAAAKRVAARLLTLTATPALKVRAWERMTPQRRLVAIEALYEEGWAAWRAKDAKRLCRQWPPEVEIDFTRFEGWPTGALYHGHEGVRQMVVDWTQVWDDVTFRTRTITLAGDRVLCWVSFTARGRDSGIDVGTDFWQVLEVADGNATRLSQYTDRDEALAAFGTTAEELEQSLDEAGQPRGNSATAS
jgi:ketosteroid isomerase-like protein